MLIRTGRWLIVAMAIAGAVAVMHPTPVAHAQDTDDVEQQLVDRFRPVVQIVTQARECGSGEPFRPTTVESVLGRADVVLRDATGAVIVDAPTAADLFESPDGTYLDLPGDPQSPGCSYERWWRSFQQELPSATYARVATDPDRPGQLVVQYWFWWIYNDWNDKHEGDWEMVQVMFDVATAEEALAGDPTQVVFAQHEGAQYRAWDSDALTRDGDRVFYFPGAGSHAGYESANRWFGKNKSAGFGCDDTRGPHTRLDPEAILIPSSPADVTDAADPFAWLTFEGRWGQKAPTFDNGPQGPPLKESWTNPVRWVEDSGRPSAVALPPLGTVAGSAFCGVSRAASLAMVGFLDRPALWVIGIALVGLVLVVAVRRTTWRPTEPEPVSTQRFAGQILAAAVRLQWRHRSTYAGLGVVVLLGGMLASLTSEVVLGLSPLGDLADVAGSDASAPWVVPVALLAGALVNLPVTAWVLAGGAAVVDALANGTKPTARGVLVRALQPVGALLAGLLLLMMLGASAFLPIVAVVGLVLLPWTVLAVPCGVRERLGMRDSFRRSWSLSRGHAWRCFGIGLVAVAAIAVLGPVIASILLIITGWPFSVVNVFAALITLVTVPWGGTVLALLREDLAARSANPDAPDTPATSDDPITTGSH